MKKLIVLAFLWSYSHAPYAQTFLDRFTLIETFDQTFKKNEPAIYSLTIPDSLASTYQVQAALGFSIIAKPKSYMNVLYEWHQNTQLDKIQNTRQFGFAYTAVSGQNSSTSWDLNAALKWSNDLVKKKKSVNATFLLSPYFHGNGSFWQWISFDDIHPPGATHPKLSEWFQYTHSITFGVDYVNFYDAASEKEQGGLGMGHLEYGAHVYLLPGIFLAKIGNEQFLDVYYIGITRRELFNETDEKRDWRPLQKYGISISFKKKVNSLKEREVKLAFERIVGEDVLKGLAFQKYTQLAFKVRL